MNLNRNQKILVTVGLLAAIFLFNGLMNLSLINIQKIWSVEKIFDNPWTTNNGSPRILQALQLQDSVSEGSNFISIPDTSEVIGSRIEYRLTYVDGGVNSPDASIDFNGVNVAKVRFLSHGQVITGIATVSHSLLASSNQITISHTNAWGGWSKVSYDVVLVLGYDAPPTEDPYQDGDYDGPNVWDWFKGSTILFGMTIPNYALIFGAFALFFMTSRR